MEDQVPRDLVYPPIFRLRRAQAPNHEEKNQQQ